MNVYIGLSSLYSAMLSMVFPNLCEYDSLVAGTNEVSVTIFPVALWWFLCETLQEKYGTRSEE